MNKITEKSILDTLQKQDYPTQTSIANALKVNKTIVCVLVNSMIQRHTLESVTVGKNKILQVVEK